MEQEKRRTPRYIFFAAAELLQEQSEVRVASRVSELSLYGCYLDMMNPPPDEWNGTTACDGGRGRYGTASSDRGERDLGRQKWRK